MLLCLVVEVTWGAGPFWFGPEEVARARLIELVAQKALCYLFKGVERGDGGVIHPHVYSTEALHGAPRDLVDRFPVGNVRRNRQGLTTHRLDNIVHPKGSSFHAFIPL